MSRIAASLPLCALVAVAAVVGAPAPLPRPSIPWVTGWDEPVGDPRIEREGDKLTVTFSGMERVLGARLMREVDGDFAMQVRVRVLPGAGDHRQDAGLVLVDGKQYVYLARAARLVDNQHLWFDSVTTDERDQNGDNLRYTVKMAPRPASKPVYLRLERRGGRVRAMFSEDGRGWTSPDAEKELRLHQKLKVGVIARVFSQGEFKATFDQFRLTPLGGKTR